MTLRRKNMEGNRPRAVLAWSAGLCALLAALPALAADPNPTVEQIEFFEKRIRPVLVESCFKCHSDKRTENGLRMETRDALLRGGDNGAAIVPGDPGASLFIKALRYEMEDLEMPPKGKLEDSVIADFEKWIKDGAVWPEAKSSDDAKPLSEHWSLKPIVDPKVPVVKDTKWVRNPIDAFVLAKLEGKGLKPAEQADARTLIRRATFDLIGLPPTPEEIATFEQFAIRDLQSAFAALIDRLLASPEYGRRWGRHWLDVARYADTSGDGTDMPLPTAYLYRNYVIDAFNRDLPYDQFIREQIAGDILAQRDSSSDRYDEQVIATGFIALARRFGNSKFADMHLVVDETLDTVGKGVLGLTISCARCHDHKFDPVSQEDYYALAGFFTSTQYPHAGSEHGQEASNLVPISADGIAYAAHLNKVTDLKTKLYYLDRRKTKTDEDRKNIAELKKEIAAMEKDSPKPVGPMAWAVTNKPPEECHDSPMMMRGDPNRLGKVVPRGFVSVIDAAKPQIKNDDSGRAALAEFLTSPKNPLTARVMVNRIWLHHYGKGIVPTPDNFGLQGKPPTHPELLDYLASRFIESGWSVKEMHKLIMMSATYRMATEGHGPGAKGQGTDNPRSEIRDPQSVDPSNTLYWRFDRRRLDAEQIRDGILAISGKLDLSTGKAHPFPDTMKTRFTQHRPFHAVYDTDRRSVFIMTQRLHKHPFLGLFDGPDTNKTTGLRGESTVPLQALYMMNSEFIAEQSRAFVQRLMKEAKDDASRVKLMHEYGCGRAASEDEVAAALEYVKQYAAAIPGDVKEDDRTTAAWASYAKLLLSSNAFIYVD